MIARDLIRQAADTEGFEEWLEAHNSSSQTANLLTRTYAFDVFGDSDKAQIFKAVMSIEIDRVRAK